MISDVSANSSNQEACVLCFNTVQHYAMGVCNHKDVCSNCVLRIRLLLEDIKCPICKTECPEVIVSNDRTLTWDQVEEDDMIKDKEDPAIWYEDSAAKNAGLELRSLQCLIYNCPSG